jgi:hypothetical protein
MGLWMGLGAVIFAWISTHTDNHFMEKLNQPAYGFEVLLFTGAALLFALMALRSAIPGRPLGTRVTALASIFVSAGELLLIVGAPIRLTQPLSEFLRVGLPASTLSLHSRHCRG